MQNPSVSPSSILSSSAAAVAPSPGGLQRPQGTGRPSAFNERTIDLLCSIIRETGASDSGAAARASLHPSTVSRWKRDYPDLAILLRGAREEFREVQLEIIHREASAGRATSWRAAAWFLERVFPEDYAPRAKERAQFQEMYEARCAAEGEGEEVGQTIGQSDNQTIGGALDRGGALQNVQMSAGVAPAPAFARREAAAICADPAVAVTLDDARRSGGTGLRFPEKPLQNVQKSPLGGPMQPPQFAANNMRASAGDAADLAPEARRANGN